MALYQAICYECVIILSTFHSPETTADAEAIYRESQHPIYLSGGQEVVLRLQHELEHISDLIDLSNIDELHGIDTEGSSLSIGAGESHAAIAESALVANTVPVLSELASNIGDPQTRNRGTIGGAIASKTRSSDWNAALLALDAMIHTTKTSHMAEDYFAKGGLTKGELITKICFEIPSQGIYLKHTRASSTDAVVGVLVSRFEKRCRVAIVGGQRVAFLCPALEAALGIRFHQDVYDRSHIPDGRLSYRADASLDYQLNLVDVLCKKAIRDCA
ncbi:MAG: FAD binding domain-containing protein [Pseudomonadota bacterium]|nr:FAD binding domain-containing protein [Pseudomonadota bacterium]